MKRTKRLTVNLNEETYEGLSRQALLGKRSLGEWVRMVLEERVGLLSPTPAPPSSVPVSASAPVGRAPNPSYPLPEPEGEPEPSIEDFKSSPADLEAAERLKRSLVSPVRPGRIFGQSQVERDKKLESLKELQKQHQKS